MRPGPIRPGDRDRYAGRPGLRARFNEARADSPGRCGASSWRRDCTVTCFNEARADSPGRSTRRTRDRCSRGRFNEARADSPGRCRAPNVQGICLRASMRPGPIRPGDGPLGVLFALLVQASMRPGPIRPGDLGEAGRDRPPDPRFNEARADSPGRCDDPYGQDAAADCASMRPGPIRPGDGAASTSESGMSSSFNEARADSPGRCCSTRMPRSKTMKSFNEARADSPGR